MTAAEYAEQHNLHRVGARPGLVSYLKQAWARRDFAYELARSRIQASNQQNRLGMLWVVLRPTLNALMYGAIFGILQGGNKPADFPVVRCHRRVSLRVLRGFNEPRREIHYR